MGSSSASSLRSWRCSSRGTSPPPYEAHAIEALNFQITWNAALIVTWIIAICGALAASASSAARAGCWAVIVIFSVIAGLKANEGQLYKYPVTVRLVK